MGNSSSSGRGHQDETVDYGCLVPQGVYTGPRDWNQPIVSQLIVARRLAPFYRPLEDYEEDWDDDQILAARKELPDPDNADVVTRIEATALPSNSHKSKRPGSLKEPSKPEAQVYRGAVECPICFLYYPPNINHSRCCDQAICTECFVQIKRAEPTATHLVSEPAACPYCVQDNFGIVYTAPVWRAGLGSDGANGIWSDSQRMSSEPITPPTHKRRQKSFSADSPEVVTTDQIRPDWEAKLEAVRAAVARRANRRIIMRQVGDRLIPVGVTSGRVHALTPEEAAALGAEATSGSRRSRRRQGAQNGSLEQFMGMGGQDLEELMLMEAMRLSLLDHEEHQRKEAEEKKKAAAAAAAAGGEGGGEGGSSGEADSKSQSASSPGPSSLETSSTLQPSGSTTISPSVSSLSRSGSPSPRQPTLSSQETLASGRRSWSISRSRTPPPPPNPIPNVPLSEENHAAWLNRPGGAPPFSTLNAALTSTSTAAAFLGAVPLPSESRSAKVTVQPSVPSTSASDGNSVGSSIPKIMVDSKDIPMASESILDTHQPPALDEHSPSSTALPSFPDVPQESESSSSGGGKAVSSSPISSVATPESELGTGTETYGFLPSSPESDILHEPLLRLPHPPADLDDTSKSGQNPAVSALVEGVSR